MGGNVVFHLQCPQAQQGFSSLPSCLFLCRFSGMQSPYFSSITEQVAAHLGAELRRGRWQGTMPGRNQLVEELGVSTRTVELAFEVLEKEGLLVPQGAGRRRKIVLPEGGLETPPLRVAVLFYARGQLVGLESSPKSSERWWEQAQPKEGFILSRMESPFAMLNADSYEAIKASTGRR